MHCSLEQTEAVESWRREKLEEAKGWLTNKEETLNSSIPREEAGIVFAFRAVSFVFECVCMQRTFQICMFESLTDFSKIIFD